MTTENRIESTADLKETDKGRWVKYWPSEEIGRIKSWNKRFVFVVYKCGNNWDDYENYTAASTHPKAIEFVTSPLETQ